MAERRRYTKRQKVAVVVDAELSSVTAAAEKAGVPRSSVRYWMDDPALAELRLKTREETAQGFGVLIHLVLARLRELIPTMEARDATILAGVAVDKAQLLAGHATARTETKDLTLAFDDHERAALQAILEEASVESG